MWAIITKFEGVEEWIIDANPQKLVKFEGQCDLEQLVRIADHIDTLDTVRFEIIPQVTTEAIGDDRPTPKLCYVEHGEAYFTPADLSAQTGDDWNDVPYESNAGTPYADGGKITVVKYDNKLWKDPSEVSSILGMKHSYISVDAINEGQVPWLWGVEDNRTIFAGASLADFQKAVAE